MNKKPYTIPYKSVLNLLAFIAIIGAIFYTTPVAHAYGFERRNDHDNHNIHNPIPRMDWRNHNPRPIPVPIPVPVNVQTPIYNYSAPVTYPVYYPVYTPTYSQTYTPTYTPTYSNYSNYYPSNYSYSPASTYAYSSTNSTYIPPYTNNQYSYNNQYTNQSNASGLNISCSVDPINATLNQPTTWNVQVTGGIAPYTYSWTGSDSLTGTQSSIVKYYNTFGEKTAIVTVTSADGRTSTYTCDNVLTIRDLGLRNGENSILQNSTASQTSSTSTTTTTNNNTNAAAVGLAGSGPWGWIALLIILILMAAAGYLLMERQKV